MLAGWKPALPGGRRFQEVDGPNLSFVRNQVHFYFYMLRGQGTDYKFTTQGQPTGDRLRLFGSQVRKNVFWTLASGVTIWTAHEVATWRLYANELLPFTSLASNPVWFIALALLVPMIRALPAGASTPAARPT